MLSIIFNFFIYFINKDKTRHQHKQYTTSAFTGCCIKCIPFKSQPLNQLLICLEIDVLGPQNSPSGQESALNWDFSLLSWTGTWNEWANPQLMIRSKEKPSLMSLREHRLRNNRWSKMKLRSHRLNNADPGCSLQAQISW